MVIVDKDFTSYVSSAGLHVIYKKTGFAEEPYAIGDETIDGADVYYRVNTQEPIKFGNDLVCYRYELIELNLHADREATSGTWHLDSDSLRTDIRYRQKLYLEDYITDSNIKKDDGVTNATYVLLFAGVDYPLSLEFVDNNIDLIICIDAETVKDDPSLRSAIDRCYFAFREFATITFFAMNKSGLTATNLIEQAEQEIKHVFTDHPLGSVRNISDIKKNPVDIEDLNSRTVTIEYIRANDDYLPTKPTVTWGPSASPTGTFTFPNVTKIDINGVSADVNMLPPGRIGNITQNMGNEGIEISFTCNLDLEPAALTWKRAQTTSPKSDANNFDVFLDIMHNGAINQEYQTLDLGWGSTLKVRFVSMQPDLSGNGNLLTVTFKEYRSTSASAETWQTRFGIT